MKFQRLRGTDDVTPEKSFVWKHIIVNTFNVFEKYGIKLIVTPVIEDKNLFVRGIGEGADIVIKEMYEFKDKKGRDIVLRPEGTASVVRAYIENSLPEKTDLCYAGPMFRYEKPQKGRSREFYQIGVESFGNSSAYKDTEIIKLAYDVLKAVGTDSFVLKLNTLNCMECGPVYIKVLYEYLKKNVEKLCGNCKGKMERNAIIRVLDCKEELCREVIKDAPSIRDFLCEKCRKKFDDIKNLLNDLNVPFEEDFRLVRGLDYYTGVVFEFVTDKLGPQQNTLLAGGRYDNLVHELGGKEIPATGFAMGIDRVAEVLTGEGKISEKNPDVFIVTDADRIKNGFILLSRLRENNVSASMSFEGRSFKSQMREADDKKARFVLIIGENEEKNKYISVKNMKTGEQKQVPLENVVEEIKKMSVKNVCD
ncbi:MAG TPA: histidine--tRNA ligase [Candidatus Goldiibacteriota bacterium]|nr:histidine--tRNA ligase [Candidatus Goldiibacteriota bacterium]